MTAIQEIAVGKLVVAPDNVRGEVGDVSELAQSMLTVGVLAPLVVREGDHVVVCGARRLAAAKVAGLKTVPCLVRPFTEQERIETMLVENLQRDDLSPLEEAAGFARLSEMGLNQRQIADRVGCSQTHVSRRLGLLALPLKVQMTVVSGQITSEEATELVKLKDEPELVEAIVAQKQRGGTYAPAVSQTVKREVEKKNREKAVAAEVKKLTKQGVNAVALAGDGYYVRAPEGFALVVENAYRSDEVEVDPVKHRKLKCSAIGVRPNDASHVEMCSNPSKHPSPADQRKTEEELRKKEAEAAKAAWVESIERRREFVGSYLRGKVPTEVAIRLAWTVLSLHEGGYGYAHEDEDELACELLGIELTEEVEIEEETTDVDRKDDGDGTVSLDAVDELARLASGSSTDKVRALAALAAAKLETTTANTYGRWRAAEHAYIELLKTVGFEPSAPELAELEQDVLA